MSDAPQSKSLVRTVRLDDDRINDLLDRMDTESAQTVRTEHRRIAFADR